MTTSRETTAGLALRWLRLTLILIFIAAAILGGLFLIAYTYGVNPGIAGKTAEAVTSGTWTGIVLATAIALFIASVRMIGRLVDRVPMLFLEGPPAFASVASAYSSLVGA